MKKILTIGLLSISLAQAKFFIGIEGAHDVYGIPDFGNGGTSYGSTIFKYGVLFHDWHAGVNLGTQHMFGNYVGLRWLLEVNYGRASKMHRIMPLLGLDMLVNLVNTGDASMGMYAGISSGFDNKREGESGHLQIPIFARLGITTEFIQHHRFELGATIPIVTFHGNQALTPVSASFGYKFVF